MATLKQWKRFPYQRLFVMGIHRSSVDSLPKGCWVLLRFFIGSIYKLLADIYNVMVLMCYHCSDVPVAKFLYPLYERLTSIWNCRKLGTRAVGTPAKFRRKLENTWHQLRTWKRNAFRHDVLLYLGMAPPSREMTTACVISWHDCKCSCRRQTSGKHLQTSILKPRIQKHQNWFCSVSFLFQFSYCQGDNFN